MKDDHSTHDETHPDNSSNPSPSKLANVMDIFSDVRHRYDLMNDIMSAGMHRLWKRDFVQEMALDNSYKLIDVACGTGDIIRLAYKTCPGISCVTGIDPNKGMLEICREKVYQAGHFKAKFVCAEAEAIPCEASSFDRYSISFGLRNISNIQAALSEAYRVLKMGGKFYCLEFIPPNDKASIKNKLYDLYSKQMIPRIGSLVTGNKGAYQYLVDSIRSFLGPEELCDAMRQVGMSCVSYRLIGAGYIAIHQGTKI